MAGLDLLDLNDFSGLVEDYYAKVFYHCVKITQNSHDSADITQNTFTKAFINIKSLKNAGAFGAWIFAICSNEIKLFYRSNQKYIPDMKIIENIKAKSSPGEQNQANYGALYSAIDILDEKYKNLIILKYFAEFSAKEIAALTGLDANLVKSRLYDARKKLGKLLTSSTNIYNFNQVNQINQINQERKKEIMSIAKLIESGAQVIPCMSVFGQKELLKCAENNAKFSSEVLAELAKIEKGGEFTVACEGKLSYDELIKILARCDDSVLYRMSGLEYYTWRHGGKSKLLKDVADYLGTGAYIESIEFILTVTSISETVDWYKKHLGWDGCGGQEADDYGHTIIRVNSEDNMSLTFKGIQLWKTCEVNEVTKNANCFVFVTGLEAIREKIISTGWDKISEIFEPGWGVRQFYVEDLNGFKLHFSEWVCGEWEDK